MNTVAFTVCFAVWMLNGVLATFLVDNALVDWSKVQIGWLIGIPVLTGSVMRLPVGVLTDRFGGRRVFTLLMLLSAVPTWLVGECRVYEHFVLASLGFGLSGASFAVGIAYTSVWFSRKRQGTALGIFGAGNAGAALTSMGAPVLLKKLVLGPEGLEAWRTLPKLYAAALVATAVLFWFLTFERRPEESAGKTLAQRLAPLRNLRVWRFGLYYFFVFGGFVALAQWLIPYYVSVYGMSIATAGLLAAIFSLPSGVIRAIGGWMSDTLGARTVMYWILGVSLLCSALLVVPRMDVQAPGQAIIAPRPGMVTAVTESAIELGGQSLPLAVKSARARSIFADEGTLILPTTEFWQEPVVKAGDRVVRKQLLARGVTHIYFQANVWVFTALVFVLGIAMGVGKAAVYRHIPDYFPSDVGVVGGIVGVIGGLGGFLCPIIFGYLLQWTGIWTTCWMFFFAVTVACLVWMHLVVRRMLQKEAPGVARDIEHGAATMGAPPAAAAAGLPPALKPAGAGGPGRLL
jgi:NNP family nitrate/nitrite transporter-like MFS transporter